MKEPKLRDLKFDSDGTDAIKNLVKKSSKTKITINIDSDILDRLRSYAKTSGIPYQTQLNKILKEGLSKQLKKSSFSITEERIQKIEKELLRLKKKLAA